VQRRARFDVRRTRSAGCRATFASRSPGVIHGLRGAEADAVPSPSPRWPELGVRWRCGGRSARAPGDQQPRVLFKAARELRYAALHEMGAELSVAHRRAPRGRPGRDSAPAPAARNGSDGLGGIPERSPDGVLVRPLLRIPREEIQTYAEVGGLSWREDASNASRLYARNRLRHDWIPGLAEAFNPRLLRAVADLAEAANLAVHGPITQGAFLRALGIEFRADALMRANPPHTERLKREVRRLTHADEMGALFKVICLSSPNLPPPAGF
jgi:hypothetical protein